MLPAFSQFEANIQQVQALASLATIVDAQTTAAVNVGDVYRASIVLAVSALDHYVHEKTVEGMLEAAAGHRSMTDAFTRFQIGLGALGPALVAPAASWLESEVRRAHSFQTFQRADALADAIRLVHPDPLWPAVASTIGRSVSDAKGTLDLIVDRRNKIAHEADCEPNGLGIKWPINAMMVEEAIAFLISVVAAIEAIV